MNAVERFTVDTVDAIAVLVKENLYTQALIILYSAIDTLTWANLPSGDVAQRDFIAWVDKYIEPEGELGCTANDLYAARCGLVHSSTAESRKSRQGEASEIWYVTSPQSITLLQEYAKRSNNDTKIVYFTALLAAFVDASQKFCDEITTDTARQQSIAERIRRWIKFVPTSKIVDKQ